MKPSSNTSECHWRRNNPVTGLALLLCLVSSALACTAPAQLGGQAALAPAVLSAIPEDPERALCQLRMADTRAQAAAPGTPQLDERRLEVLGRAYGEPAFFIAPPTAATETTAKKSQRPSTVHAVNSGRQRSRIRSWVRALRNDKASLRAELLRDGYLYSEDPYRAYAMVRELTLSDLFDEDTIWLQRGETAHALIRVKNKYGRRYHYQYSDGLQKGRRANVLHFDRVALERAGLDTPLHRDIRALRDRIGFERIQPLHVTAATILAKLRFEGQWVDALLDADGAKLQLTCLDADRATRTQVEAAQQASAEPRQALAQLHVAIADMVDESLPFDRPRGVKDHLSDGQLRPRWRWAYKQGRRGFEHEGEGYAVYDSDGRPHPPQMCVELILDTYERASGTWYTSLGGKPERSKGQLDFSAMGITNRASVMAFETFAKDTPDAFEARRFPDEQSIEFRERERFFTSLKDHADDLRPGDVVAIRGPKPDGYVHQHAILIADTDPITGFPYALFDHMSRPRLRTWENIMAEAPKRRLLYHIRLRPQVFRKLAGKAAADPGEAASVAAR